MLIEFDHGMKNFGFFFDMEWQILISFFDEIFDLSGKFDVHFFFFLKNPIAENAENTRILEFLMKLIYRNAP